MDLFLDFQQHFWGSNHSSLLPVLIRDLYTTSDVCWLKACIKLLKWSGLQWYVLDWMDCIPRTQAKLKGFLLHVHKQKRHSMNLSQRQPSTLELCTACSAHLWWCPVFNSGTSRFELILDLSNNNSEGQLTILSGEIRIHIQLYHCTGNSGAIYRICILTLLFNTYSFTLWNIVQSYCRHELKWDFFSSWKKISKGFTSVGKKRKKLLLS